ncbi:SOSS complex subunit C [Ischnura elegans]|uniref:SOSS complex subunit C n=1 Tax=Ischnura elegans TaxID=197161 RepID=UPI001ED88425|nr:SOSS complex subunit C [Ischnura elegans]
MAFQPTNSRQELQNRKILEELQLKKQLLLKQGAASALNNTPITPAPMPVGNTMPLATSEQHLVSSTQRSALQFAHAHSFGFFVTQDSLFGNLILPVLPRFDVK